MSLKPYELTAALVASSSCARTQAAWPTFFAGPCDQVAQSFMKTFRIQPERVVANPIYILGTPRKAPVDPAVTNRRLGGTAEFVDQTVFTDRSWTPLLLVGLLPYATEYLHTSGWYDLAEAIRSSRQYELGQKIEWAPQVKECAVTSAEGVYVYVSNRLNELQDSI